MSSSDPKISVIVASHNGAKSIAACLEALEDQRDHGVAEIIVIDNSEDGSAEIVRNRFPKVELIEADRGCLIPHLWHAGIEASRGEIVALTTSNFVPDITWAEQILAAHAGRDSGVGGAIENDRKAGLVSWAVYFCRYSAYMLPFAEKLVDDFAADNASYKRRDLNKVSHSMRNGFWEPFVHREMLRAGMSLSKSPKIVVYHRESFDFLGFVRQRYWHGREYGLSRTEGMPASKRMAWLIASPLIPAVYVWRIIGRVAEKRRNADRLIASFPILLLFLLSWSAGEFSGYLWRGERQ